MNAEKPKQKPVQRQAATQGPKREPIKIPVNASGCKAARAPGKPYFVEFRSRTAVSYGHTFVFHGRLGDGNRFASYQVAGLHPKGDDPNVYMQGMMVPVESETGASWGDLDEQYLTAPLLRHADGGRVSQGAGLHQASAGDQEDVARHHL